MAYDDDRGTGRDLRPDDRRAPRRANDRYADGSYRSDDDDRGFFDRATDEVRTWFGDDEAERRRAHDEREDRGYDARDYGRRERVGDYDRFAERRRRADEGRSGFGGYIEGGRFTGRQTGSGNDFGRGFVSSEQDSRFDGGRGSYDRAFRSSAGGYGPDAGRAGAGGRFGARSEPGFGAGDSAERTSSHDGRSSDVDRRESFRGRGPQGYSRSAERIAEDVNEALMDDHDVDASGITVSVENGEVTLSGTASSRREKRLAEQVADHVRGVRDVHNQLRVQDGTTTVGTSGSGTDTAAQASGDGGTEAPMNPATATAGRGTAGRGTDSKPTP